MKLFDSVNIINNLSYIGDELLRHYGHNHSCLFHFCARLCVILTPFPSYLLHAIKI